MNLKIVQNQKQTRVQPMGKQRNKFSYTGICLTLLILFCYSCGSKDENFIQDLSFSTSTYYPSFLFSGERNDTLRKSVNFHFNDWAVTKRSEVTFGIFDEEDKLIGNNKDIKFWVNEVPVKDGKLTLQSYSKPEGTLNFTVLFSPAKSDKNFKGFIKVYNTDLDRINNQEDLNQAAVLSWSASQKVILNPLLKYLLLGVSIVIAIFIIWLLLVRPIVYRRFSRTSLTIQSPFFHRIPLNGSILLTLQDKNDIQNWKERLLKGKKLNYSNNFFSSPIVISPKSRTEAFIKLGTNYTMQPFSGTLKKGHSPYIIINSQTKEKITITLN